MQCLISTGNKSRQVLVFSSIKENKSTSYKCEGFFNFNAFSAILCLPKKVLRNHRPFASVLAKCERIGFFHALGAFSLNGITVFAILLGTRNKEGKYAGGFIFLHQMSAFTEIVKITEKADSIGIRCIYR